MDNALPAEAWLSEGCKKGQPNSTVVASPIDLIRSVRAHGPLPVSARDCVRSLAIAACRFRRNLYRPRERGLARRHRPHSRIPAAAEPRGNRALVARDNLLDDLFML